MPVVKPEKLRFYIAGPFFNPPQLDLIEAIEDCMVSAGVDFYSPRLHSDNKPGKIDNEKAKRIFRSNVTEIRKATHVLAVLDWKLPKDIEIRQVEVKVETQYLEFGITDKKILTEKSHPLHLPDSGTVFEMGFANCFDIPIIGFTERDPKQKLNVMLTQSCRGVCFGLESLSGFLSGGSLNYIYAPVWNGENE